MPAKRDRRRHEETKMKKLFDVLRLLVLILAGLTGILFIVYFWNLDQKLLGWAYVQVNQIFDRKKTNIKF